MVEGKRKDERKKVKKKKYKKDLTSVIHYEVRQATGIYGIKLSLLAVGENYIFFNIFSGFVWTQVLWENERKKKKVSASSGS